jgi:hypothetical protein
VSKGEAEWSPAIWTAGHAKLFAPFRELSDDVAVLSEEIRGFLDVCRVQGADLTILDFGGARASSWAPRLRHKIAS